MLKITFGINKMELSRRLPCGNVLAGLQATSKATMCPEINGYENYGPVPKAEPMLVVEGHGGRSRSGRELCLVRDRAQLRKPEWRRKKKGYKNVIALSRIGRVACQQKG